MNIKLTEDTLYYLFVLVLAVLIAAYAHGYFDRNGSGGGGNGSNANLEFRSLTPAECDAVRSAVNEILRDMGSFTDIDEALRAFRAELPRAPRDIRPIVMDKLGTPLLTDLRDSLLSLEGSLPH
jgi:hypothetical protein